MSMKSILVILLLTLTTFTFSQPPGGGKGGQNKTGEIFGKITDSLSEAGVSYATVLALNQKDNKMVNGVVTGDNGAFSIPNLPLGTYSLKVSFVGYNPKIIRDITLTEENSTFQIKDLKLSPAVLNTVEVIGDKPLVTYEIDKKIVNVEDQLNTEGQTAIEILENIPSISISADGTISLRGSSSFTLLIDGIPTIMDASDYLATIPANTIKEIEIITNPSAKYDAEGTSGVINVITKKSKLEGISFLLNGSVGTFGNYSSDMALNIKKKKFTFDLSADYSQRSRPKTETTERTSTYDSLTNVINSEGETNWRMGGWGVGGGIQWAPNNSHVLVARGNFKSRLMSPYNDLSYESYDDDSLISAFETFQHMNIDFINSTSSLFYQYNIKRNKDHHITFKAIANVTAVEQNDTTISFDEANNITAANRYTETGPSNSYRFNIDYRLPLKDKKFEVGLQSQFGQSGDIGKNYSYNTTSSEYEFDSLYSSDVDYIRDVHAAYSMFGGKFKDIGYQAGLRAEYTYRTISSTQAVEFTEINRLDWFPSAHFSYNLKNKSQLLASYSRRIKRPRSYYFEPFITWKSPFSVSSGNPNLQPTYINAFEINFMQPLKKKGFFSLEGYFRRSVGIIQRISTVYTEGILISKPHNIGTSNSYGLEASLNYSLTDWWKLNAGSNIYFYDLSGSLNDIDYSAQSLNYSGRLTNTFTVKGWALQLVAKYKSGSVTSQGESLAVYSADATLKKSFFKKRVSFSLQGRNIFATQRNESFSTIENVYVHSISI